MRISTSKPKRSIEGGADILLVETCQDTRNIKAALLAIARVKKEIGFDIPVMVSGTIEPMGTMLAGQTADALWSSHLSAATAFDRPELRHRPGIHDRPHPHAGGDRADARVLLSECRPPARRRQLRRNSRNADRATRRFVEHGWLNMVGGCCGTTPAHIRALAEMVKGRKPRAVPAPQHRSFYSGIELVEAEESNRPLLVGERTNVIGSRAFKDLVTEEKWEEATEIARRQVRNGAQVIDVCLQSSERDEAKDIPPFYDNLIRKIKAPVMIDTTDAGVDRACAHLLPGQKHHQLHQSRRRRGKIRARLPARACLWRRAGGRMH